jgi:RHS repeat-associated protein
VFKQNNTTRMTTTKRYDSLNRLISSSSAPSAASGFNFIYSYNSADQRTRSTLADGNYWLYGYDSLGQVTNGVKYWQDGTEVAGQQFGYAFDDIGNRTSTKAGGDQNGANLRSAGYSADNLNRYTSRDIPGAIDTMGLSFATNTVTITSPDAQNNAAAVYRKGEYFRKELALNNTNGPFWELVTVAATGQSSVAGDQFVPKTREQLYYDPDGNLTNDGRWQYTWDAENRLTGLTPNTTVGPQISITFEYDWQGRRIHKQVWPTTDWSGYPTNDVRFVYDGWNLLTELNATNNAVIRSYLWGKDLSGGTHAAGGIGGLLEVCYNGAQTTNCFVAFDGNGNVAALADAASTNILAHYEYGPFGELLRATGPMAKANPFRFSTKYQDDETDLMMYPARPYNPSTGHWLSRDPAEEEQGGPNLYGFVGNDPVGSVDYLGLFLVAVDGTDSEKWVYHQHRNSFVKNFADDYRRGGGRELYFDGPHTLGGGVAKTVVAVYNAVADALSADPNEEIDMIGHSRGGLIVIIAAKLLQTDPPCGRPVTIHFMGLYDAVGMYLWTDPKKISGNVEYVAHARRDPKDRSRPHWGNVGTSGGQHYTEKFFWCTHSGMGGDPWGGDHPSQMTEAQDDENSPKVDAWIRSNARQRGLNGL